VFEDASGLLLAARALATTTAIAARWGMVARRVLADSRHSTPEVIAVSSLESIMNFVQLAPDIGTSGQPDRSQFEAIREAGYDAVINLALATSDRAIDDEGSIVSGLGMRYVHIPVDFDSPTLDDLRTFLAIMRAFEGKNVWVHCAVNARVSAFSYHYLKHVRGQDEASCRSPILDKWKMDETWLAFMQLTADDIGPQASPSPDQ
jgi:protein tyrosine phosphatase (PTP) superfamily phosphohydrolase (DUF442 family)